VPDQVPADVKGDAGGQRGDEQLRRGRRRIFAARTGGLVGQQQMAPGGDRVRIAANVRDLYSALRRAGRAWPGLALGGRGLPEQGCGKPARLRRGEPRVNIQVRCADWLALVRSS
jgi:hypothetical protein